MCWRTTCERRAQSEHGSRRGVCLLGCEPMIFLFSPCHLTLFLFVGFCCFCCFHCNLQQPVFLPPQPLFLLFHSPFSLQSTPPITMSGAPKASGGLYGDNGEAGGFDFNAPVHFGE